ncbi:MAG: MFS transporter [Burkholderiales bacterium]
MHSSPQKSAFASALAPFSVRSFRYQWPADLTTSWAFEMETLILGWYVLVETRSVFMLTLFASLQYVGTLISPMFGVMGDRLGHRNVLAAMRAVYATCAATLMVLVFTGALTPMYVLIIAAITGLVRPSDVGVRAALTGDTMPPGQLIGAMGIQRTTQDSAKIAGALTGAGLVALLGMGPAYAAVTGFYILSVLFTLNAGTTGTAHHEYHRPARINTVSPWRDLREGMVYVWNTPLMLATMCLAFLLNLTAFPLMNSLMPVVAKEIFQTGQTGLGYLSAAGAGGALVGSLLLSRMAHKVGAARTMIIFAFAWYLSLMVFAQTTHQSAGIPLLMLAGMSQATCLVPMLAMILRNSDQHMRGRIMGIRMLAIYGNIPGLLIAGPLIANFSYPTMASIFCVFGMVMTLIVTLRWRTQLWRRDAPANRR